MICRTFLPLVFCSLILASVSEAAAARDPWRSARTEHFEVFSSVSEKKTREVVVLLEQFRASFIATFALRPAHEPRVTVMLFDSDRAFTPYKPLYQGKPKDVSGYFVGGLDEVVIALKLDSTLEEGDDPLETVLHEYVHLLLHTRGLKLPTWLNEGLAEVFSTFRLNGGTVEYGRPKDVYVTLLNHSALMPMSRLLAVDETSPYYNEEMKAGMFYAQSWAMAHFLLCGADRANAQRLGRYLQALAAEPSAPDAKFREIFAKDFDQLESKLRTYLQGGRYYQRSGPAPLANLAGRITLRAATDFERDFALLNLRWRVQRPGETMMAALQLAQQHPESPRPHELLAAIAAQEGEFERAFEGWQRAAELRSESSFAAVQGARWKLRELGGLADLQQRLSEEDAGHARLWLDRAVTRSPDYDDAVEMLAWIEARAPEFRVSVVNLVQGRVQSLQDPNPTLLALAVIRWRAKDVATAASIVQAVLDSPRAKAGTKAEARLLQWQIKGESTSSATAVPQLRPPSLSTKSKFLRDQPEGTPTEPPRESGPQFGQPKK